MTFPRICPKDSQWISAALLSSALFWGGAVALSAETPVEPAAAPLFRAPLFPVSALPVSALPVAGLPVAALYDRTYAPTTPCHVRELGSPYISLDSWMYPALSRLYSLGYLDLAFLGLRPWTRSSVIHMLEDTSAQLEDAPDNAATGEAQELYDKLWHELNVDAEGPCGRGRGGYRVEGAYTVMRGMSGNPLHDSFHLGESITNDYGRPFQSGYDNYSGASGYATAGIFTIYGRAEVQHAPAAAGYSQSLFNLLSSRDQVPLGLSNPTIPLGPIDSATNGRLMEGYVSAHVLWHNFTFGKSDFWLGPGQGGAYAYSNNAENQYTFRIDRTDPLRIPLISRLTGPFRYEFAVGSLKGHSYFRDPWMHLEKISFKPTPDLEIGFERTVIWGGKGHVPITIHSFLKSFFSLQNVTAAEKFSRNDPGARFGAFDLSYRLPYVRNWLTFLVDSEAHDDVNPVSAPRRADFRTGLYLSHVPGIPKLDVRVEAVMDDQSVTRSLGGAFTYYETEVPQGYTNAGQIFGDWMGREAKGGQAWFTWHLSGNEWIQASWRGQKAAKDFIPGGTTINDGSVQVVKRFGKNFEVNGSFTHEKYLAPIYLTNKQSVNNTTIQLTWHPDWKKTF